MLRQSSTAEHGGLRGQLIANQGREGVHVGLHAQMLLPAMLPMTLNSVVIDYLLRVACGCCRRHLI